MVLLKEDVTHGVLFIGPQGKFSADLVKNNHFDFYHAQSFSEAQAYLKRKSIKVILSADTDYLGKLKNLFPEPVRILLVDKLDVSITQSAINQGEVFRFVLNTLPTKELSNILLQGAHHYDLVTQHQSLLINLKSQNKKLEKVIQKLERQVSHRTVRLQSVETELNKTKRSLEQLNALIAWINASSSVEELAQRVEKALKGILPVEKIILSESATEDVVRQIKKMGMPSIVMPLIYERQDSRNGGRSNGQKNIKTKCLGHLYFLCRTEEDIITLYNKVDLMKQVTDTVALTLEKIHIFNESVERKEEWQKTFDAILDPVSLVNKDFKIVRANLAYSKISHMKIQELVGKKCFEVFQKRSTPCEGCLMKEALDQKKTKNFELKSKAQSTTYVTSSFPLEAYHRGLETQGLVVQSYRNQGEERKLQDQLIQSEKMAEIGILAGSVAHEINNPLGGILAYTQILLSEVSPQDPLQATLYQDLKEMETAALRSKGIVENLLYFSRVSREEDREFIDMVSVVDKALSMIELKIRHKKVTIEKHIQREPEIPKVFGDFNQWVQVFLNLMQNSVESILEQRSNQKKEGKRIDLFIRYRPEVKKVEIRISDTGRGIEPQHLANIFNPFFTTKNKSKHPGLGLAVSYQMIKNHGGEIKAESQFKQGSTFIVLVPVQS